MSPDLEHSAEEERWGSIGMSAARRLLVRENCDDPVHVPRNLSIIHAFTSGIPFAVRHRRVELRFEWDSEKARANLAKHGISFEESRDVFMDPFSLTIEDPEHSIDEVRILIIGVCSRGRLLVVSHTVQGDRIRLIGARRATPRERFEYEEDPR